MILQERGRNCPPTFLATYPGSLPFPKGGYPPVDICLYVLTPYCPQMNPGIHIISLVLLRFVCRPILLKIFHHVRQCFLHPDRISPYYPSVICIKSDVVFSRRPSETMLSLLGSTDLPKGRPDYYIHYDIKQFRVYWVYLCQPSPRDEGAPVVLP